MSRRRPARWMAGLLAAGVLLPTALLPTAGRAQAADTTPAGPASAASAAGADELAPKFIWGVLLNIAFKMAMEAFGEWLSKKATTQIDNPRLQKLMEASARTLILRLSESEPFGSKDIGASENTTPAAPVAPLVVAQGRENYQGVQLALVGFDGSGNVTGLRPMGAGWRTGERFKVKVLPTFDGWMSIDNINPRGQRRQIYPPQGASVVAVKAGVEILLPLGAQEFFEFSGDSGDEQLVVTLRDPRAVGQAAATALVNRQDQPSGTLLLQQVSPGSYPVIAQGLRLSHSR